MSGPAVTVTVTVTISVVTGVRCTGSSSHTLLGAIHQLGRGGRVVVVVVVVMVNGWKWVVVVGVGCRVGEGVE